MQDHDTHTSYIFKWCFYSRENCQKNVNKKLVITLTPRNDNQGSLHRIMPNKQGIEVVL